MLPQLIISDETLRTIPIAINAFFGQYVMKWDLALPALVMAIIPAILGISDFPEICGRGNGLRCCKR